jgi:aspartate kinase
MPIIVQKYGGTSVGSPERIRAVAERIVRAKETGAGVVAVVSAMGDVTDELVALAAAVDPEPPEREMDMLLATGEQVSIALLAMAIHALGHEAISFTGPQVGIVTDHGHTKAKILEVRADRVREALDQGRIVIVAGFQGVNSRFDITTLGRGGSDTTAVALAVSLGAQECQILTDVDGVYTADPRLVPEARKLDRISYEEMLELASLGARVMHNRAVELGEVYSMPVDAQNGFLPDLDRIGGVCRWIFFPDTPSPESPVLSDPDVVTPTRVEAD